MQSDGNLFADLPEELSGQEDFLEIFRSGKVRIERIVSTGQCSPEDFWYDQEEHEWVILLQGKATILYEDGTEKELQKGDFLFLPAHLKHRVSYTSKDPCCIWLGFFWLPDLP